MPRIVTREGENFNLGRDTIARGRAILPVRVNGVLAAVNHIYDPILDCWCPEGVAVAAPDPVENSWYRRDNLVAPEFHGWELVKNPSLGRIGDCYVCIDPNQPADFARMGRPSSRLAEGYGAVNPKYGNPTPSPGFRIYRKKRAIGPTRLLPSTTFSQPLPLP